VTLRETFREAVRQQNNENTSASVRRSFQKLLSTTVGERDYSAQETMHLLMGYELHGCSREFTSINPLEQFVNIGPPLGEETQPRKNSLEAYLSRPLEHVAMCWYDYERQFKRNGNRRKKPAIARIWPKPKSIEDAEEKCKMIVLLFVPFTNVQTLLDSVTTWADMVPDLPDEIRDLFYDPVAENEVNDAAPVEEEDGPFDMLNVFEEGNVHRQVDWMVAGAGGHANVVPVVETEFVDSGEPLSAEDLARVGSFARFLTQKPENANEEVADNVNYRNLLNVDQKKVYDLVRKLIILNIS
jgi:hypothetical protein